MPANNIRIAQVETTRQTLSRLAARLEEHPAWGAARQQHPEAAADLKRVRDYLSGRLAYSDEVAERLVDRLADLLYSFSAPAH